MENFICPACKRRQEGERREDDSIVLESATLEEVENFCYLGNVLDSEGGKEMAVRRRVEVAWQKWREISSLLVNSGIPVKSRANVYEACIRPVMLYGSETWPLTERMKNIVRGTDRRMLRYVAGVRWQDWIPSVVVLESCGLEDVESVLRRNRLK